MTIFVYDHTFEGLLTTVFEAYARKRFPDTLLSERQPLPLFADEPVRVHTDVGRADRVWRALQKKLSAGALNALTYVWLSEEEGADILLFRYMRKVVDAPVRIETCFSDPDVLAVAQTARRVSRERLRLLQFLRFQKAADGTLVGLFSPLHNVLPLGVEHFRDRLGDRRWLIYDTKRHYGYYSDGKQLDEVTLDERDARFTRSSDGRLDAALQSEDEQQFRLAWQTYFKAVAIRERINPRKQKQDMPLRYWKYLTEKQG